jgi:hypothetical protein
MQTKGFQCLRNARIKAGKTLEEVGIAMGIQKASVHFMEIHSVQIVPSAILAYADAVGADPFALAGEMCREAIERLPEYNPTIRSTKDPIDLAFPVKKYLIDAFYADANGAPYPVSVAKSNTPLLSEMFEEYKNMAQDSDMAHLGKKDFRRALLGMGIEIYKISVDRAQVQKYPPATTTAADLLKEQT